MFPFTAEGSGETITQHDSVQPSYSRLAVSLATPPNQELVLQLLYTCHLFRRALHDLRRREHSCWLETMKMRTILLVPLIRRLKKDYRVDDQHFVCDEWQNDTNMKQVWTGMSWVTEEHHGSEWSQNEAAGTKLQPTLLCDFSKGSICVFLRVSRWSFSLRPNGNALLILSGPQLSWRKTQEVKF